MSQELSVTFNVTVDPASLSFAPNPALPHAKVGSSFPPTSIGTVSGGTSPYTFAVTGGLPDGMALSPAGVLSGTPTAPGAYAVQVTISDATA